MIYDLRRCPVKVFTLQKERGHSRGGGEEIPGRVREQTRSLPELQPGRAEAEVRAAERGGKG